MKRSFILTAVSAMLILACSVHAAVAWQEDFDPIKATWIEASATWTDLAGTTARLTESDPVQTYGVSTSEIITVDVGQYSELVIETTNVDAGAYYSVQIQDACDPNVYADAVSYAGDAGTHVINIAALMGWNSTKSFVINLWIDGDNKSVTYDLVELREPVVAEGWTEDFDPMKSTWNDTSATWTDISGTTAKLTENDPVNSYGVSGSEVITVDTDTYNELVIESTAIDSNTLYSVQIQQVGGAGASADAVSYVGQPGTQIIDIAELMGWSGVKSFKINVWIDGEGGSATFDLLQIRQKMNGQTGWLEDFDPIKITWDEESCYWTDTPGPNAVITENNPSQSYGVSKSEVLTLDVNFYDELYVKTTEVESGAYYSIQIHEVGPTPDYNDAVSYMGVPSEHVVDIASLMNWSGTKTFQINIWIEGEGKSVTFDTIELRNSELGGRPEPVFWQDDFNPVKSTWSEIGAYWDDLPGETAQLVEDQPGQNYGKVESESLLVDLDVYPELTVVVTDVETGGYLDVGIQEQGGSWTYKDVTPTITDANTYKANIATEMGWSGYKNFRVIFWINGNGKAATFDDVRIAMDCGTDVLLGDYHEDCIVDLYDLAVVGQAWLGSYGLTDLKDISDNWLLEHY